MVTYSIIYILQSNYFLLCRARFNAFPLLSGYLPICKSIIFFAPTILNTILFPIAVYATLSAKTLHISHVYYLQSFMERFPADCYSQIFTSQSEA